MDAGDWIAIVALLVAAGSVYYAWRSARASEGSAAAAKRSADAAEKSAHADLEQLQLALNEREKANQLASSRPWVAESTGRDHWVVKFRGEEAYDVRVDVEHRQVGKHQVSCATPEHMVGGDQFTLRVSNRYGFGPPKVQISWAESDEWEANRLSQPIQL